MGKAKNKKKAKPLSEHGDKPEPKMPKHLSPSSSSSQAMDGHNTQGWTESQVKAYNELLVERKKLEKQRQELEQRSAKSQAGRALLNEKVSAIDRVFHQQKLNGNYKFIGKTFCCVDIDSKDKCHHEVCTRSKTGGLSFIEMDTIRYYYMRIFAEKSERMRNALRKQRDLELVKLKKDEDEGRAKSNERVAMRSNSNLPRGKPLSIDTPSAQQFPSLVDFNDTLLSGATKETQRLVTNILEQLDHLRSELHNGQITSVEMQKQLDIIDAEMQAAHLKTANVKDTTLVRPKNLKPSSDGNSASSAQSLVQDLLSGGTKADTYTKAFQIMESFLSASKPSDFQLAVAELKGVLRLSGPMGKELKGSFDALEGIFDSPDRLSFTGPDGKQECTSIIDLMEKMKETMKQTGHLPEGANSDLTKVFQECIDLEKHGREVLREEYQKWKAHADETDFFSTLSRIRDSFATRSPIPPLTEKALEDEISDILAKYDAHELITKAENGMELVVLEGHITSMVMNRARKAPEKYIETITKLADAYEHVRGLRRYRVIDDAFPRVTAKMETFLNKLIERNIRESQLEHHFPLPTIQPEDETASTIDMLDQFPDNTAALVNDAVSKFVEKRYESDAHLALRTLINDHGSSSLWPIWLLFAQETAFRGDHALQEKSRLFEDEVDRILTSGDGGMKQAIFYLYAAGACPGMCGAIVSEILASTCEADPNMAQTYLKDLVFYMHDIPKAFDSTWMQAFRHLVLAMLQLYVAVHVNATILFPQLQADDIALSAVAMMTTYVCLMESPELAEENLKIISTFLNTCFSSDGTQSVEELLEATKHYEVFCRNALFRCITTKPCSEHFSKGTPLAIASRQTGAEHLANPSTNYQTYTSQAPSGGTHIGTNISRAQSDRAPDLRLELTTTIHTSKYSPSSSQKVFGPGTGMMDSLHKAAALYESTSRKAQDLMRFPFENVIRTGVAVPSGSVTAQNQDSRVFGNRHLNSMEAKPIYTTTKQGTSRFSEHIDEGPPKSSDSPPVPGNGLPSVDEDIMDAVKTGQIPSDFHDRIVQMMIRNAFGGFFPNPLTTYEKGINLSGDTPWSRKTYEAMLQGRDMVRDWIKIPENYAAWTAKRIQFLLSLGGTAESPTVHAMCALARNNFSAFEEYAAFLARERARTGQPVALVKRLCDEVYDLLADGQLDENSTCIQEISTIAREDWPMRNDCLSALADQDGNFEIYRSRLGNGSEIELRPGENNGKASSASSSNSDILGAVNENDELMHADHLKLRLQKFMDGFQNLDQTRGVITSFTGIPGSRRRQPQVVDDLMGKLSRTKDIVNDIIKIIADQGENTSLQPFTEHTGNKTATEPKRGNKGVK